VCAPGSNNLREGSIGVANRLGPRCPKIHSSVLGKGKIFFSFPSDQIGSEAHLANRYQKQFSGGYGREAEL
jgi:hypothetical protein